MANYDQRAPQDYKFGQLTASVTSLDTTLTSAAFTSLPSDLSTTKFVPITLADDSLGVYETVWATAHSAGSTAVTVIRAREGTTARAWATGAVWRCAPTVRDTLPTLTRATLPSDAHIGMRAMLSDEGQVVEKVSGGWISPFGNGTARRSLWQQNNTGCPLNTQTIASGLAPVSGYQTSPATMSGGVVTLNKPGFWYLWWGAFWDDGRAKWIQLQYSWPNGPQVPVTPATRNYCPGGYGGAGTINQNHQWLGYVSPTQATSAPLTLSVWVNTSDSSVVSSGIYYTFWAEYIGG